jgi:hypothetical protein
MDGIGETLRQRFERIVVENEMLRAGFAAVPYLVLRDTRLSVGARLAYAILLIYAWQEGSCFPGQVRMANDMGVSTRHLRRALTELRELGYISWRKLVAGGTNTYTLHEVKSKLKAEAKRTPVSAQWGQDRPANGDADVHQIDVAKRPREIDPVLNAR